MIRSYKPACIFFLSLWWVSTNQLFYTAACLTMAGLGFVLGFVHWKRSRLVGLVVAYLHACFVLLCAHCSFHATSTIVITFLQAMMRMAHQKTLKQAWQRSCSRWLSFNQSRSTCSCKPLGLHLNRWEIVWVIFRLRWHVLDSMLDDSTREW